MADRPNTNLSSDNDSAIDKAIRRYQDLLQIWRLWAPELQELSDYVLPRKSSIQIKKTAGTKRTQKLFDSTAIRASEMLASSMHGTLTSSSIKWFTLETDDQKLNEDSEVREWLQAVGERMIWEINRSNFSSEAHEIYLDLTAFGTGCLFEDVAQTPDPVFSGLEFQSVPCGRYVVGEAPDGRANTLFRTYSMSNDAIVMRWKDKVDKEILAGIRKDELYEVVHGVYPAQGASAPLQTKWDSVWFLYKDRKLLEQKGYYEFPFMVPRWTKVNGETYGRGPSHTALPDIKSLNKVTEMELKALAKVVDPPVKILSGDAIGPVRLTPGGGTVVRSENGVSPLLLGIDFKVSNLKSEELRKTIREIYYSDQLQLQEGPQMTAEEVRVRYELMQRILGPALGRLESEFLKPIIDRTFAICQRANLFPPIPSAIQQARVQGKVGIKIRYEGPLARAQKAVDAAGITELFSTLEPLMQIDQQVADVVDFDEAIRSWAIAKGIPATAIRDAEATAKVRAQRAQQQQQDKEPEKVNDIAGAIGKAGTGLKALNMRPEPGSPMARGMAKAA